MFVDLVPPTHARLLAAHHQICYAAINPALHSTGTNAGGGELQVVSDNSNSLVWIRSNKQTAIDSS